jgi:Ala-tRNA(Pro) deacylase
MEWSMRIPLYLSDNQVVFDTLLHPPAFTAQKRAKYLRVPGSQLAKSVLLTGTGGQRVAVLPATHQVDTDAVNRALGGEFHVARAADIAKIFRDCEWGVLGPFGTLYGLSTILDDAFDPEAIMVFEAHLHGVAIRMRCRDFERLERPRRFCFAQPDVRGQK